MECLGRRSVSKHISTKWPGTPLLVFKPPVDPGIFVPAIACQNLTFPDNVACMLI